MNKLITFNQIIFRGFFVLVFSNVVIAQRDELYKLDPILKKGIIKEFIIGKWHLVDVKMENLMSFSNKEFVEAKIETLDTLNLLFTNDSIYKFTNQNYYYPVQNKFKYEIMYDSTYRAFTLNLYQFSKKKRVNIEYYTISLCTPSDLVLEYYWSENKGLANLNGTISLHYQKFQASDVKIIDGDWRIEKEDLGKFLKENDTSIFVLKKLDDLSGHNNTLQIKPLKYCRSYNIQHVSEQSTNAELRPFGIIDGVYLGGICFFDLDKKLIYFKTRNPMVYHFELGENKDLKLQLDLNFTSQFRNLLKL